MNEWISVVDQTPPVEELVLAVGPKGGMFLGRAWTSYVHVEAGTLHMDVPNSRHSRYASHWMALPKAPK